VTRAVAARLLRLLLVAGWTAAVFAVVVLDDSGRIETVLGFLDKVPA